MKIDKAIELLEAIIKSGEYLGDPDDSRAVKLGIEALKEIKAARTYSVGLIPEKLPGETKE